MAGVQLPELGRRRRLHVVHREPPHGAGQVGRRPYGRQLALVRGDRLVVATAQDVDVAAGPGHHLRVTVQAPAGLAQRGRDRPDERDHRRELGPAGRRRRTLPGARKCGAVAAETVGQRLGLRRDPAAPGGDRLQRRRGVGWVGQRLGAGHGAPAPATAEAATAYSTVP